MNQTSGVPHKVISNVLVIDIHDHISEKTAKEIVDTINAVLSQNSAINKIVFDMKNRFSFDVSGMRLVSPLAVEFRKQERTFHVLGASKDLQFSLAQGGMTGVFKTILSLNDVIEKKTSKTLNVDFLNPFIDGTIETLKVQCSLECQANAPTLKENLPGDLKYDIAGVIGITSTGFTGSIAICFPEKVFLAAMSSMIGEDCPIITSELEDGAGELLNIIFGHAKRNLNEKGYTLDKAIPTVIRGKEIAVKHMTSEKTIALPFDTQFGRFCIEIGTETNSL